MPRISRFFCVALVLVCGIYSWPGTFAATDAKTDGASRVGASAKLDQEKIIKFYNDSLSQLTRGHYSLAGQIAANVARYRNTWKMPPDKPRDGGKAARQAMEPPAGIFNMDEEKELARALDDMDAALDAMLDKYGKLAAYAADENIRDDGEAGDSMIAEILAENEKFAKARGAWLAIVERKAEEAENSLLSAHPLRGQVSRAGKILAALGEIAALSRGDSPSPDRIRELATIVRERAKAAAKPPFPATPALERLYRQFLKRVGSCEQIIDRSLAEGMGAAQRREILNAVSACVTAYNDFAKAMNKN